MSSTAQPNPPLPPGLYQYQPSYIQDPTTIECNDLATFYALTGLRGRVANLAAAPRNWFAFSGKQANGLLIPYSGTTPFSSLAIPNSTALPLAQFPFSIDAADAGYPNVQNFGTFQQYAAWVAALPSTTSYLQGDATTGNATQPIPTQQLFTVAQANALVAEIVAGNPGIVVSWEFAPPPAGYTFQYDGSGRRKMLILVGGLTLEMEQLMSNDTGGCMVGGVGVPGAWVFTAATAAGIPASLIFVEAQNPPGYFTVAEAYTPTRPLDTTPIEVNGLMVPTEQIVNAGLFAGIVIQDNSVPPPIPAPIPTPSSGGGLTSDQNAALLDIQTKVTALFSALPANEQ
jgi:hypothetical protein